MTNPDNVGWLPTADQLYDIAADAWDQHQTNCRVTTTAGSLRKAVEAIHRELCRAAPAGGDRPETMSPPEFDGSHVGIEDRPDMWPDWVHRVVENAINEFGVMRDNERQPQGTTSGGSPDYSRITPPDSAPAGSGEVSSLADTLGKMADNAYCDCIRKMQRDECLGWEEKVRRGSFSSENLRAHVDAGELLGRHRALHEAAALLRKLQQGAGEGREG